MKRQIIRSLPTLVNSSYAAAHGKLVYCPPAGLAVKGPEQSGAPINGMATSINSPLMRIQRALNA
jgi:hypothetical protein